MKAAAHSVGFFALVVPLIAFSNWRGWDGGGENQG